MTILSLNKKFKNKLFLLLKLLLLLLNIIYLFINGFLLLLVHIKLQKNVRFEMSHFHKLKEI